MAQCRPPTEMERREWEERQKAYLARCKKRNEENPPKNLLHKIGRGIWDMLWYPQPPTY